MTTIVDHLTIPCKQRNMDWLKAALQIAIELEHSTLPLYLSGMFSLKTQNYTSYNLIRSVAMEEMVHMAVACNILSAIGGTPRIKTLDPGFPSKGLPGGAEPDLTAVLAKVSTRQLENYLRVEMPDFLLPDEYKDEKYPTIAGLYDAIKNAIGDNADEVRAAMKKGGTSNQIGDDIGFTTIKYSNKSDPLDQLYSGIQEILEQGEGLTSRTLHAGPASESEPAHYCKFAEIYYGARYRQPQSGIELTRTTEPEFFKGYRIPFPNVVNTLAVPKDGYAQLLKHDPNAAEVKKNLLAFDKNYTVLMNELDAMWNGPADRSWPTFGKAVRAMFSMRVLAAFNIMKYEVPANAVARLGEIYPEEYDLLSTYTDLQATVFYGPRFVNQNVGAPHGTGRPQP